MTDEETFEFLKTNYFDKAIKLIQLLKKTLFNDLKDADSKLKIANSRFVAAASSISLSEFIINQKISL